MKELVKELNLSTTSIAKPLDIGLLYDRVEVPNPYKVLPRIQDILNYLIDIHNRYGIRYDLLIYGSNAMIGDNTTDDMSIIIPKFQVEFIYKDMYVNKDKSYLSSIHTISYSNFRALDYHFALYEHILVCKNGSYSKDERLYFKGKINKIEGLMVIEKYLSNQLDSAIDSLVFDRERLHATLIDEERENKVIGDLLRKSHTKNHIVDISIITAAVKYSQDSNNPFKAIGGSRSLYDFMQDFTYIMKTTEINTHITKNKNLVKYFHSLCEQ